MIIFLATRYTIRPDFRASYNPRVRAIFRSAISSAHIRVKRHSFRTSNETLFRKRAVIKFPEREIAMWRRSISYENRSRAPAEPGLVKSRTGRFFNRARVSPPRSHVDKGNAFYGLVKTPAGEGRHSAARVGESPFSGASCS